MNTRGVRKVLIQRHTVPLISSEITEEEELRYNNNAVTCSLENMFERSKLQQYSSTSLVVMGTIS